MKHFAGIERCSEHVYANVYGKANSSNVRYKVRSIQVDGGSEFIKGYYPKDFEETCREFAIPLFVLPPAKTNIQRKS